MRKLFIVILLFVLSGCTNSYLDNYNELTKEDYNMEYNLDDIENMFISINYNQTLSMLNNKETFLFYFGGSWCKNCRPVVPFINEVAKEYNIDVYNLDPRNGNKESIDDFRKCNNKEQTDLYRNFINTLGYKNDKTVIVEDKFGNKTDTLIPSLSVPAVLAISKGVITYSLIEEYEIDDINDEIENYYKGELRILINKL